MYLLHWLDWTGTLCRAKPLKHWTARLDEISLIITWGYPQLTTRSCEIFFLSLFHYKSAVISGGSRISQSGTNTQVGGAKTIILTIFPKNCMKSKNIEPGGDTHTNPPPPTTIDKPLAMPKRKMFYFCFFLRDFV